MSSSYDGGNSFINCTLSNNTAAGKGGGICYASHSYRGRLLANTIIWANNDMNGQVSLDSQIFLNEAPLPPIDYCCIQGTLLIGTGWNLRVDPLFIDADGEDNVAGTQDDDLRLSAASPCINAGYNEYVPAGHEADLDGAARIFDGRVDMGAYESSEDTGVVRYVDDDATAPGDGLYWFSAYKHLADALMTASSGDEIRIAQGIYRPDQFALSDRPTLGRSETFTIPDGVTLMGGFAGLTGANPNERDVRRYETILSGDLLADDLQYMDHVDLGTEPHRQENSLHVVTTESCSRYALLDGLTITGGNANGDTSVERYGGGVYGGTPTLKNCTVLGNWADYGGGGIYFEPGDYGPDRLGGTVLDSTIRFNCASFAGGIYWPGELANCVIEDNVALEYGGGGVYMGVHDNGSITDCLFRGNTSAGNGGAMAMSSCSPRMVRCRFVGNHAGTMGGAIYMDGCSTCQVSEPVLDGCEILANTCDGDGGGFYCWGDTDLLAVHCVIAGNTAVGSGGGIRAGNWRAGMIANCTIASNTAGLGGGVAADYGCLRLRNCILWGNLHAAGRDRVAQIWSDDEAQPTVDYSCVHHWDGAFEGTGNIDVNPLFADFGNRDYHLKSQAGRYDPVRRLWVMDDATSPCIDAGDPFAPIGPEPFPNGGRLNMGAYGGTAAASKSWFGRPVCRTIMAGDINGDCRVDFLDFRFLAMNWLRDTPVSEADPEDLTAGGGSW